MKKYFRFFVVFLVFSCLMPHIAFAQAVDVPDGNLAQVIRTVLGIPKASPILKQQMRELTIVKAQDLRIVSITGLEFATQLEEFSAGGNHGIRDLRPLENMKHLRTLDLSGGGQLSDLRPLGNLPNLRTLDLAANTQISDFTPLANLPKLTYLNLFDADIDDRELLSIALLTNLTNLQLGFNNISDVNPLARLRNLTELSLIFNKIQDVSPLARLTNLIGLAIRGNPIQDLTPLAGLTKLVNADFNRPTPPPPTVVTRKLIPDAGLDAAVRETLDITRGVSITRQLMQRLTTLDASNREIKNLSGLENATQLQELILSSNHIKSIRHLTNLTQLVVLDLRDNAIQGITPLENLMQLLVLDLRDNEVQNLSPLARLTRLQTLDLNNNQIRYVNSLVGLTRLKELRLAGNDIRNVSTLTSLVNLETLEIAGNPITDTSPLSSLTNLVNLDIDVSRSTPPKPTRVVQVESFDHPPMYWVNTNTGTLHRLVGTEVENLVPSVQNATHLAIDVANEKLYWTEQTSNTNGRIRRANLNGTNVQLVKNLTSVAHGIAFDAVGRKLYLANAWGKIQRLNVDGSNFQPNLITDLDMPRGIVLDMSGRKIYWAEASGRIRRANLNGSNVQNVASGLGTPMGVTISGDTVYWTLQTGVDRGEIRSANLLGNPNIMTRHTFPQGFPVGIAVDGVENKLYWTISHGSIGRSNLNGSNLQPNFVTGLRTPGAFVLNVEPPVSVEPPVVVEPPVSVETPEVLTTGAVVGISPSPVISPAIGEQLTLRLNITAGEEVAGYQVTVEFDATALRYVESSNASYLPVGAFVVPPVVDGNRVKLASTALSGVSNGDGTLATLTFEVVAEKASTLTLSDVLLADSNGDTVSPQVENGQVTEAPKLEGDLNSDDVVNIQDLVLVASNFGQTGENVADVNGDGVVNITDLVKVAGALGNVAAAPSLHPQLLETLMARDVQQWLSQAQHLNLTDATSQRGIHFLEQLLTALIPKESALLPNYPNPFNPETWIPYQLVKPADVTLTIYAVNGRMVRQLSLGHQFAGIYQSRGSAAYWDGRNALGEPVASGVYFYTLTAGDFSATRKMLIRK